MKSYTFSEYKKLQEMSRVDKFLGELKKNRKQYAQLVFLLALIVPKPILAQSSASLGDTADELIQLLLQFGRYGCLGMGLKTMIETMIQGGDVKDATGAGIQYFLFYIVLYLYPKIFAMLKF